MRTGLRERLQGLGVERILPAHGKPVLTNAAHALDAALAPSHEEGSKLRRVRKGRARLSDRLKDQADKGETRVPDAPPHLRRPDVGKVGAVD